MTKLFKIVEKPILGHFLPSSFLPNENFIRKNPAVIHNLIRAPHGAMAKWLRR